MADAKQANQRKPSADELIVKTTGSLSCSLCPGITLFSHSRRHEAAVHREWKNGKATEHKHVYCHRSDEKQ